MDERPPAMATLAEGGTAAALALPPNHDPDVVEHSHDDLPSDHPNLREECADRQAHSFVIDDEHPR